MHASLSFFAGRNASTIEDWRGRSYRPSQEDVVTFQTELQSALAKLGL
jgi:hypothetical protein